MGRRKRLGHLPRKKSFFCPQNDKSGCILTQFLTGRKHGQSLEVSRHGFYGSIAKRSSQNSAKIIPQKSQSDQRGRGRSVCLYCYKTTGNSYSSTANTSANWNAVSRHINHHFHHHHHLF